MLCYVMHDPLSFESLAAKNVFRPDALLVSCQLGVRCSVARWPANASSPIMIASAAGACDVDFALSYSIRHRLQPLPASLMLVAD